MTSVPTERTFYITDPSIKLNQLFHLQLLSLQSAQVTRGKPQSGHADWCQKAETHQMHFQRAARCTGRPLQQVLNARPEAWRRTGSQRLCTRVSSSGNSLPSFHRGVVTFPPFQVRPNALVCETTCSSPQKSSLCLLAS